MDFEASFKTKLNAFNNENRVLLVASGKKEVKMLHSPKNFVGSFYRSETPPHPCKVRWMAISDRPNRPA